MEIIDKLITSKAQILEYFDLPEETYPWSYAEGKWNIRHLLCHIVDAESVLYERVRRIIAEQPNPVLWAFDQDAWAAHLDYNTFPVNACKLMFSGIREGVIHLVNKYYLSHGDLPFVHSSTGQRTLKDEMDKIAWHSQGHLDQIAQALDKKINS
ncbi:MAG: DinB family protein [Saprospiraceae bacterium]